MPLQFYSPTCSIGGGGLSNRHRAAISGAISQMRRRVQKEAATAAQWNKNVASIHSELKLKEETP